jgi:hypothetical protein
MTICSSGVRSDRATPAEVSSWCAQREGTSNTHLGDAGVRALAELQAALLAVDLDDARRKAVVMTDPVGQQPLCAHKDKVTLSRCLSGV